MALCSTDYSVLPNCAPAVELVIRHPQYSQPSVTSPPYRPIRQCGPHTADQRPRHARPAFLTFCKGVSVKSQNAPKMHDLLTVTV